MKVALLSAEPRISPVFETTRCSLMVEITEKRSERLNTYYFISENEVEMANELLTQGAQLIVCGAIPYYLEKMLISQNCEVIPFVAGDIEEVLEALCCDSLDSSTYKMPGCQKRQQRKKQPFCKKNVSQDHPHRFKKEK